MHAKHIKNVTTTVGYTGSNACGEYVRPYIAGQRSLNQESPTLVVGRSQIDHIKENIGVADVILVSSHAVVRKALEENDIKYELVYPNIKLKEGYLERYRQRGNEQTFIDMMNTNWGKFIKEIKKETFPTLVELQSGQYLDSIF